MAVVPDEEESPQMVSSVVAVTLPEALCETLDVVPFARREDDLFEWAVRLVIEALTLTALKIAAAEADDPTQSSSGQAQAFNPELVGQLRSRLHLASLH
jgi:hypothetical protein